MHHININKKCLCNETFQHIFLQQKTPPISTKNTNDVDKKYMFATFGKEHKNIIENGEHPKIANTHKTLQHPRCDFRNKKHTYLLQFFANRVCYIEERTPHQKIYGNTNL